MVQAVQVSMDYQPVTSPKKARASERGPHLAVETARGVRRKNIADKAKCQLTTNSCQISSLELPGERAATMAD